MYVGYGVGYVDGFICQGLYCWCRVVVDDVQLQCWKVFVQVWQDVVGELVDGVDIGLVVYCVGEYQRQFVGCEWVGMGWVGCEVVGIDVVVQCCEF